VFWRLDPWKTKENVGDDELSLSAGELILVTNDQRSGRK
jgi:hypothetical protein